MTYCFLPQFNKYILFYNMNEDNFIDEFTLDEVEVDNDCISDDIDDYDLYGQRMVGNDKESDTNIEFE